MSMRLQSLIVAIHLYITNYNLNTKYFYDQRPNTSVRLTVFIILNHIRESLQDAIESSHKIDINSKFNIVYLSVIL